MSKELLGALSALEEEKGIKKKRLSLRPWKLL